MEMITQTLTHTPWWVYVLLIYLTMAGVKAAKPQVVPLKKLFIIPAVFTFMSIHTLLTSVALNYFNVISWMITILVGGCLGWWQIHRFDLKINKKLKLIEIPGTWTTLIIIWVIFAAKYYFGFELSNDPDLASQTWFEVSMLAVSGAATGFFIGRLACYMYRFITSADV